MKVIAYYILHYGADYLWYSMRSIYDHVDEIVIVYTDRPSHGSVSGLVCPDTRQHMKDSVFDPKHKVAWIDGTFRNEGEHRKVAENTCKMRGADIIVLVDADEIWTDQLPELIDYASKNAAYQTKIKMHHLWKRFDLICTDVHRQGRIFNLNATGHDVVMERPEPAVYHFGYAISDELMEYKISIHGHKHEWRAPWFDEKWMSKATHDLHPVCIDFWNAEPFDMKLLPEVMQKHPKYGG